MVAGSTDRTAAEQLIAAKADEVDIGRYEDPPTTHKELIRLAAEARGLDIVDYPGGYIGYSGERAIIGTTPGLAAPSTSVVARKVCGSKSMTQGLLRRAGVAVPEGSSFKAGESERAIEYVRGLGWPVVLKPGGEHGGRGVVMGIRSVEEFRSGWRYAVGAIDRNERSVIVEREHDGVDVRVFVVGRVAVAGVVRLPPHVRGDGESTVEALVEQGNQERLGHPYLFHRHIKLDEQTDRHLGLRGLTRTSILEPGEIAVLRRTANVHLGGLNVDVTDELPAELVDAAVSAVAAVPGLDFCGVDFLMPDVRSANGAVVLELNSNAEIPMAHFPVAGEPRDVAGAIVDRSLSAFS